MAVQAWFAQDEIEVRPGEATSLSLAVENLGEHTESFTIIPAGLTAGWTTVTRPSVTLFGGSRDVIEVVVRPPAIHTTSAGPTTAVVRVIPQQEPDEAIHAEATLNVQPFDDRRISVLQPLQRGRRHATYEFMVENHGNNLASCRLHLVDPSNRVDGTFDPPAVGVAPGSKSLVRLRLKAKGAFLRRADRQLDFEIEATQPDHEPAIGHAALIQPPTIPARAIWRVLAAAAVVAAIVLAWVGVVRPALDDAAERAVEDQIDELGLAATGSTAATTVPTGTSVPVSTPPVANPTDGEPFATRIPLTVGVGLVASDSIAVPADRRFEMTDLVVQNPNRDVGTATLLRNSEVLYEWDLRSIGANEFQGRVTPLPFQPSDNIVFQASCEAPGPTSATGCDVAVLIGGRLVPPA
ncbi:MAG TPA: hypothetical protein VGK49_12630 [Ilumatobacteraceae bacterium]